MASLQPIILLNAVLLLLTAGSSHGQWNGPPPSGGQRGGDKPPNFVVIFVDDQDYLLNTTHPSYMPALNKHIIDKGLQLRNFLISTVRRGRAPRTRGLLYGCHTSCTGHIPALW